jgi:hypothetical protein
MVQELAKRRPKCDLNANLADAFEKLPGILGVGVGLMLKAGLFESKIRIRYACVRLDSLRMCSPGAVYAFLFKYLNTPPFTSMADWQCQ